MNDFLPVSKEDIEKRGLGNPDFVFVTGDAYVDHPSFAMAILSRVLEANGFSVAILAQPNWKNAEDFKRFGRPRLAFLVSGGNIDSMVNHYTAAKKPRSEDMYSPGGKAGARPDRAVTVYCNRIREAFSDANIIIGGIEASLRRFAHYDYWDNKVRRSVLFDSKADLLIYGMGERTIVEAAKALDKGIPVKKLHHLRGTCYIGEKDADYKDSVLLSSYEDVRDDKRAYAISCREQYAWQDPIRGKTLLQPHGDKMLVQNPPQMPLSQKELDAVYALPYMRTYHPMYEKDGGVPAISEVKFSITSCRGCYGACNFCALTFHQGRIVTSRSHESIINEARKISWEPDFKGYIHDVGGPTANFRAPACKKQLKSGACKDRQCLYPSPCKNLEVSHEDYLSLLRKLRSLDRIKKVFVRSGLRYDYIMADKDDTFFRELLEYHVSGQLKVAPEHICENVLSHMGKPGGGVYEKFAKKFYDINREIGKEQYLVPYLMSSHPGSALKDAVELSLFLRDNKINPQQVQDFYPTPGTISTAMFYTELDPYTLKKIYVAKTPEEKAMQRALLQYKNPANRRLVLKALKLCGREDLIGFSKNCLIRPEKENKYGGRKNGNNNGRKSTFQKNKGKSGRGGKKA